MCRILFHIVYGSLNFIVYPPIFFISQERAALYIHGLPTFLLFSTSALLPGRVARFSSMMSTFLDALVHSKPLYRIKLAIIHTHTHTPWKQWLPLRSVNRPRVNIWSGGEQTQGHVNASTLPSARQTAAPPEPQLPCLPAPHLVTHDRWGASLPHRPQHCAVCWETSRVPVSWNPAFMALTSLRQSSFCQNVPVCQPSPTNIELRLLRLVYSNSMCAKTHALAEGCKQWAEYAVLVVDYPCKAALPFFSQAWRI